MRQIAGEVGVQVGALYLYTPDKQTLLFDLMVEHLEALLAAWAEVDVPGDPVERLKGFARFHIRYHMTRTDEVFIAYMELRNLSPENFAKVERLRRLYERILEDIVLAGDRQGVFQIEDARITTLGLIAMLTGVNTWYRAGGRLEPEAIERMYCDMALGAVGAAR